jgi:tetraacyldisaccharide 4'-kinase
MSVGRWLLWPLSALYAGIIRVRNRYYDRHTAAVQQAGVPVISVGNLTVGGTGKTPMVIEIVRRLRDWGRKPAILTRGYAAGRGEHADEVREFHAVIPDVPVVVNPDRVAGAAAARAEYQADCLVLDDGFQHRRLGRDVDIVLIDALQPWGGDAVLPAGRLREPRESLRRADALIITRANQVGDAACAAIERTIRRYNTTSPIARAAVRPDALVDADGRHDTTWLRDQPVQAVCGIGNPQTFARLLRELVGHDCPLLELADHQHYGDRQLQQIAGATRQVGAAWVVTTRKDWVKLAPIWPADLPPLVRLDVRVELVQGAAELEARLRQGLENARG